MRDPEVVNEKEEIKETLLLPSERYNDNIILESYKMIEKLECKKLKELDVEVNMIELEENF